VVYGFGRIDASGRVADRAIISAPGWRGGDRLTLTAEAGVMVARRDPGGMVTVPARPHIVIPAALRHRCGLRAGDRVLLATLPGEDALAGGFLAPTAVPVHAPAWNRRTCASSRTTGPSRLALTPTSGGLGAPRGGGHYLWRLLRTSSSPPGLH
jgi:hypothetical protein